MGRKIGSNTYKNIKDKYKSAVNLVKQKDRFEIMPVILLSVGIVFLLEMLSRRSILKGLGYVIKNPAMFLLNVSIIIFTLSFTKLFRKRNFIGFLVVIVWLGLGITNFILLFFRTTPLTAMDFYLLDSVFEIIPVYLNTVQIIAMALLIPVIIFILVLVWRKAEKKKPQLKTAAILLSSSALLMVLLFNIAFRINALSSNFSNLPDAYSNYGFAYCFSNSIFDRGIKEPEDYSEVVVDKVIQKIEDNSKDVDVILEPGGSKDNVNPGKPGGAGGLQPNDNDLDRKPNIIMVQLESFFDVNLLMDYNFSENPIPYFTQLKEEFSSGYLMVPSIGAGTANTEFEILAGMNIQYFGAGEYPYKTILQTTTSESISFDLAELGYHSHAIHNNTGTFYDRHKVYQKLGFDSFTSIEYMNEVEYNPVGWAKDKVLTTEIMKSLEADTEQDFIYAVSVQPHGKYPENVVDEMQNITVRIDSSKRLLLEEMAKQPGSHIQDKELYYYDLGLDIGQSDKDHSDASTRTDSDLNHNTITPTPGAEFGSSDYSEEEEGSGSNQKEDDIVESYRNQFEYYVNQLAETDQFIGELISVLSNYEEPTVVVFFGDHLPSLSLVEEDVVNKNLLQTEYVFWSNFPMEQDRKDLKAYQLTAYLQSRLGYSSGVLTKYHQRCIDEPDYEAELMLLQYDMLYGNRNVFEGENPYIEKPIRMGIYDITIHKAEQKGEAFIINGEHFTPWSMVYVEDEPKETIFIDEHTLIVPYENLSGQKIHVAQVTDTKTILSRSEEWVTE